MSTYKMEPNSQIYVKKLFQTILTCKKQIIYQMKDLLKEQY